MATGTGDRRDAGRCIVNLLPLDEDERAQFTQAASDIRQVFVNGVDTRERLVWPAAFPRDLSDQVTAIIGNATVDDVRSCRRLQWLQTWSAGFERYAAPGVLPDDVMITNASGAYGPSVSEHLFAMMWSLMKRLPGYAVQQTQGLWCDMGTTLSPFGGTAVIIGTGDIGSHFARLVHGVGMHTIGIRRHIEVGAEGIDEMHAFTELDEVLPRADVLAMVVPSTPQTRHLLGAHNIGLLRHEAIVLNAGRGDAIDAAALTTALDRGSLWGAGLDVTDPEPLPAGHPLWKQPRCLITPHVAGGNHLRRTGDAIIAIALENVRRYAAGEALTNRRR